MPVPSHLKLPNQSAPVLQPESSHQAPAGGTLNRAQPMAQLLDPLAHWRVRFAMMAMLVVAVLLLVGTAVQSEKIGKLSRADIEVISIAAEQSLLTERIGLTAALLSREVGADRQRIVFFEETLVRAQIQAHRMDAVLSEQALLNDAAHEGLKSAYQQWLDVRDKVWLQARLVITYADHQNAPGLQRARAGLEATCCP